MKVPLPNSVYSRIALLGEISELEGEIFITCLHFRGESGRIWPPNSSEINTVPLGPFYKALNVISSFPFMVLLVCGIQQQLDLLV